MHTAGPIALLLSSSILAGNAATPSARDFSAAPFDRIVPDTAGNMNVVAGAGYSIHAEGDPSRVAKLAAAFKDGTLTQRAPGTKSDGRKPLNDGGNRSADDHRRLRRGRRCCEQREGIVFAHQFRSAALLVSLNVTAVPVEAV